MTGTGAPCYWHDITLTVGGHEFPTRAGFIRTLASDYGVLGQDGFFNFFVVKFDLQKEVVELSIK